MMSRGSLNATSIRRLFETGSLSGLSEWQLLDRFARSGDQIALELLVSRHGPMVLGVCRRILRDPSDVDDAFQATFLVLIRRAGSLGPGDVLAAWLHGVALKVATRARADRARRAHRERGVAQLEAPAADRPDPDFALREVIDQEIERLPWRYRAPVALCYFEGLTHEEAAHRLDWPLGTVKGRLARARALLGERLRRRGISSPAGSLVGAIGIESVGRPAVSEPLLAAASRAAARIAEGAAWMTVVSVNVANLVRGVFTAMLINKLKTAGLLLLVSGTALAGAGYAGRTGPGAEEANPRPGEARPAAGDGESPASGLGGASSLAAASPRPGDALNDAGDRRNVDPRTAAILKKLDEPLSMNFPNETPLEDVLKYIQQATQGQGPDDTPIPIYVDPIGLNEAEQTMTSPVSIDLEGVPLRRTLQLALKQLDMKYFVDDGILVVTSAVLDKTSFEPPPPEPTPLLEQQEKARRGELEVDEMKELVEKLKLIRELEALEDITPEAFLELDEKPRAAAPMTSEQADALLQGIKELTEALKAAKP